MAGPDRDKKPQDEPSRGLTPVQTGLALAAAAGLFALLQALVKLLGASP
ncbi:MAG: hypothetical protein HYZ28_24065 [Myxococcales bacterium]|nr:hypothetical protein [Myxococcales bacterium]